MKDLKIYTAIACTLLLLYLVAEFNQPLPVNWAPTLYYGDKIPFGTYVLHQQLTTIYPGAEVINTNKSIYNGFHNAKWRPGNYIIVAKTVNISKADFDEMTKYIKAGGSVFISAFEWKGYLNDTLKIDVKTSYLPRNPPLNFSGKQLKQTYPYKFDKGVASQYFSKFDTARATVISQNSQGYSNVLNFKFGNGNLILCADPLLFSNYALLKANGDDYAAKVLSYLPAKKCVYWDEYQNGDIMEDKSPMRVLFSYSSLRWAYYLSLFSLVAFILFEVKRRQRIIPVMEPLQNSTLDFVRVVGQVYYEKRDNANIAHKKIIYLLSYLRERYLLKTNELNAAFISKLIQKTGIEQAFADELVAYMNYLNVQSHVSDHELVQLNQLIEKFYSQS